MGKFREWLLKMVTKEDFEEECREIINIKLEKFIAKIESIKFEEPYSTTNFIQNGISVVPITINYDAVYKVQISGNDNINILHGEPVYNYCKNKVGSFIEIDTIRTEYNDGSYNLEINM